MTCPISIFDGHRSSPPGGSIVQLMLTVVLEAVAGDLTLISSSQRPSFHLGILFKSFRDAGFIHTSASFYKNEKLMHPLKNKAKWRVSERSG